MSLPPAPRSIIGRRRSRRLASAALLGLLVVRPAVAAAPALVTPTGTPAMTWPDDRLHRLAALALVEELRAALLSENSATLTLENWCRRHRIAPQDASIVAEPVPGAEAPLDPGGRTLLGIDPAEPVRYRRVRLLCGDITLSDADNWYVPSRLTPDMNRVLDTTHTPFGKAIAALGFTRATLDSRLLWSPLPPDWFAASPGAEQRAAPLPIPPILLRNRALLRDRNGHPLALLVERYHDGILAFPPPP